MKRQARLASRDRVRETSGKKKDARSPSAKRPARPSTKKKKTRKTAKPAREDASAGKDGASARSRAKRSGGRDAPPARPHGDRRDDSRAPPWRGIVGVGASAGGLEAVSELLKALPADFDMPVVLIQHLARWHESHLAELLGGASRLPVVQAADAVELEGGRVYVIPPDRTLELDDYHITLAARPGGAQRFHPIGLFFESLAARTGHRAIGVVLSGTASDGANGLRAIHAAGGLTMAQYPDSAAHAGMPQAAIATGAVDVVAAPAQLARELGALCRQPLFGVQESDSRGGVAAVSDDELGQVLEALRRGGGVDLTQYKKPTLVRRLQRRMALRRADDAGAYLKLLRQEPEEARKLREDMLIHVTSFFREPRAFQALAEVAFPEMLRSRRAADPVRIWVPGCATGEDAYSVAIALTEFLGQDTGGVTIQVFATDVSERLIGQARSGSYPRASVESLPPERVRRFFVQEDETVRIAKPVRDLCVFAQQDLLRDPPFSRLDLIVCRNVFIYLSAQAQKRLLGVFAYALRPGGFLMLGGAETTGAADGLFTAADEAHRLFRRRSDEASGGRRPWTEPSPAAPREGGERRHPPPHGRDVGDRVDRLLMERYAPSAVLVDADFQIVQTRGHTGRFLELSQGRPSLDVLKMARQGLLSELRRVLREARRTERPVSSDRTLRVLQNCGFEEASLEVLPVDGSSGGRHFLVLFKPPDRTGRRREAEPRAPGGPRSKRARELENELQATREHLESIIHDLEAANEELQSANEEILSSNEELQSTNEELDTAKEELQSSNEELNSINDELHAQNVEVNRINSDLLNLLDNVDVAIVMVSRDLRVRRFTPKAEQILNLIPSDLNRSIGQIRPDVDVPDLEELIAKAIDGIATSEREVRDSRGRWYLLRVRPYKDVDNRIDGAVIALFDVAAPRRHAEELQAARSFAMAVIDTFREPLAVLDAELRVQRINPAFTSVFGIPVDAAVGKLLSELGDADLDPPALRDELEAVLEQRKPMDRFAVVPSPQLFGGRRFLLHGRRIDAAGDRPHVILLTFEEARDDSR